LILGSWSAIDGASCDEARIVVLSEGSKVVMVGVLMQCSYVEYWANSLRRDMR
jgi:hypothetical protein